MNYEPLNNSENSQINWNNLHTDFQNNTRNNTGLQPAQAIITPREEAREARRAVMRKFQWVIVAIALLYVISPIDVLPDFIPVLGWIDDILIGGVGIFAFFGASKDS